jgi:hypothetical protein
MTISHTSRALIYAVWLLYDRILNIMEHKKQQYDKHVDFIIFINKFQSPKDKTEPIAEKYVKYFEYAFLPPG